MVDNGNLEVSRLIIKNRTKHKQENQREQKSKEQCHFVAQQTLKASYDLTNDTYPIFFHTTNPVSPFL